MTVKQNVEIIRIKKNFYQRLYSKAKCSKCSKIVSRGDIKVNERINFICGDCLAKKERLCSCGKTFVRPGNAVYCVECSLERKKIFNKLANIKSKTVECICGKKVITTLRVSERKGFLCNSCKHPKVEKNCCFCNQKIFITNYKKNQTKHYHKSCRGAVVRAAELMKITRQAVSFAINKEIKKNDQMTQLQVLEKILKAHNIQEKVWDSLPE